MTRHFLAICATALVAGAALTIAPPAGTATGSAHRTELAGTSREARAAVTDIREIVNTLAVQVQVYNAENGNRVTLQPKGSWIGSMWVPWAGNDSEVQNKSIRIFYTDNADRLFYLFQDYWAPNDQVRFFWSPKYYEHAPRVEGAGTGGGRKRLIIYPSNFAMENVG
ncbi:hypothetical protein [Microbispora sp. NPDC046933]|uniref:hypothetical protein n=1 Tax=Microbispora sp. NPDC046933 TaxID=3155618 RepID=UPI0034065167